MSKKLKLRLLILERRDLFAFLDEICYQVNLGLWNICETFCLMNTHKTLLYLSPTLAIVSYINHTNFHFYPFVQLKY